MKKIFESLHEAAESLAESWVEALEKNNPGGVSTDHAARAVRDLLGPLAGNGAGSEESGDFVEEAGRPKPDSQCLNNCRELFAGRSRSEIAHALDLLAEAAEQAVRKSGAESGEADKAIRRLHGYFKELEKAVQETGWAFEERTMQLIKANKLLHSLFQTSRNAVVFLNADKKIIDANASARQIFNRSLDHFLGQSPRLLFQNSEREKMAALVDGLDDGESENTEAWAVRSGQERFPCEVTVTRVKVADETVYHLILVDRSETEELKETLERERKHIREMSVTLKNVIKSVDEDKQEFMENLAHNVEIELVPALDKMSREESGPVRDDYKEVIEDKLRGLANGTSGRLNNLMMKLTPTEIQVCKYIQAGHGTKEIADMMSSSFETVQTHRKNIRKKLELTGRQVSLSTFLRTLPEADES